MLLFMLSLLLMLFTDIFFLISLRRE